MSLPIDELPPPPRYYPAFLDLRDRRVVVFGGGPAAARRIAELLPAGADVVVIAPALEPELVHLVATGRLRWVARTGRPADLAGAALLVAADPDRAVNRAAAAIARSRGVLVQGIDDPEVCDIIAPAVVHRGGLTVAVSTGGRSPAFARYLRELLEDWVGDEFGALLAIVADLRRQLAAEGRPVPPAHWSVGIRAAAAAYQAGRSTAEVEEILRAVLTRPGRRPVAAPANVAPKR